VRTDILPATGTSVWTGAALASGNSGIHHLDAVELAEIDTALRRLRGLGAIDLPAITMAHFPLFRCRDFLGRALLELRHGLGFLLLRGLPRDRYDADDMARIYFGLGTYLGACLPQSYLGELLGNVVDVSDVEADARGYHAGGGQRMHTDTCDIVSLMCLRAARTGGASRISSAMAVHNELLRARPDLLELLYEGYVCRRMELDARHGDGALVRHRAMYARQGDEVWCNISGSYPRRAAAAGDAIMPCRIAGFLSRHEHRRGRHPVPQQSTDPAWAHRLRGLAGDRAAPPHAAAVAFGAVLAGAARQPGNAYPG
jgi:hypothetical protein